MVILFLPHFHIQLVKNLPCIKVQFISIELLIKFYYYFIQDNNNYNKIKLIDEIYLSLNIFMCILNFLISGIFFIIFK